MPAIAEPERVTDANSASDSPEPFLEEDRVTEDGNLHLDNSNPEQPLLQVDSSIPSTRQPGDSKMTRLGMIRAYYLGAVCCIGGFLFGYDSGIIGGVLTLKSFRDDFGYGKEDETLVTSLSVSLQQLGAFIACFAIWPVTHRFGRRWSLVVCSTIFCIGAFIQTMNTHSRTTFYVARIIAGLGLGGSSVIVPMYCSEMTPKQIRGQVGSFYQLMYTLGIFTSYWTDYGVAQNIPITASRQWQIPIGMQLLPAALLGLGMLLLKESTRWLTAKERHEEAWESLKWIRADDSPETELEMDEIRAGVEFEAHAKEGFQYRELINAENFKRTSTAALVFIAQQATGATAFAYYGPQYFKLLVGSNSPNNTALLLTGIFGAIKVAACLFFVLFVAETLGRRHILAAGAVFMAGCQITTAFVLKSHPAPSSSSESHVSPSGIATVALIYLFVIAYNLSWGPLPWPYVAEIFPARIREPGIGIGVASQWLFNFVFTLTTPYMINDMGWGTFLMWGIFDVTIAAYAWFGLTETRGRTLEEISGRKGASFERRVSFVDQRTGGVKRYGSVSKAPKISLDLRNSN